MVVHSAVRKFVCRATWAKGVKQSAALFILYFFYKGIFSSPMTGRHWYTTDRYKVLEKDNRHTPLRAYKEPKVPGATGPIQIKRTAETPDPPTPQ